jgi:Flp pilus assembly protein TadD
MSPPVDDDALMNLVEAALRQPPGQRASFIAANCLDTRLRAEAEERVAWEEKMAGFLSDPVIDRSPAIASPAIAVEPASVSDASVSKDSRPLRLLLATLAVAILAAVFYFARNNPATSAATIENRALARYRQERYAEALVLFQQALTLAPDSWTLWREQGDAYFHLRQRPDAANSWTAALPLARQAINSNPHNAAVRASVAYLTARLGDPTNAEFELSQALTIAPRDPAVLTEAVRTAQVLNRPDIAVRVLRPTGLPVLRLLLDDPDARVLASDPAVRQLFAPVQQ